MRIGAQSAIVCLGTKHGPGRSRESAHALGNLDHLSTLTVLGGKVILI